MRPVIVLLLLSGCCGSLSAANDSPGVVAHRGLLHQAPENTLAAFRSCLSLRMGFEVDIRRAADGPLVCIHDETVDRTTNGSGRVDALQVAQLKSLDAGKWFGPEFSGEQVPTANEVFAMIKALASRSTPPIAIDLKSDRIEEDVVELAVQHQILDRLLFIGLAIRDAEVRQRLRNTHPDVQVACVANRAEEFAAAVADQTSNWVYFRYLPSESELTAVRQAGKKTFLAGPLVAGLETSNWRRAAVRGIDAILTDYPIELGDLVRGAHRRARELRAADKPPQGPQRLAYGAASDVQMDDALLQRAVDLVRASVEDDELRGAVLLVAREGKIVVHEALGYRDEEQKVPLERDALFRMASNSKAVTAAGILKLVESGYLELDDPVRDYVPAFDSTQGREITVRQLLTHTSGMRIPSLFLTPLMEPSAEHPEAPTLTLEVARFGPIGAAVTPGTTYQYNNAGYNTLAGIVESLTGSYADYLRSSFYDPLGMETSCNHESVADHARMSTVFRRRKDGAWQARWRPGDAPDYPFPRGSGGMVSSALEYAAFCQMMMNGGTFGGQRILGESLVRQATQSQKSFIPAASQYGLGWKTEEEGVFSHSGSDGTWAWVDPRRKLIGMVLTQTQSSGNTTPRLAFRRLVNAACTDLPGEQSQTSMTEAEGFYKDIFMSGGSNLTSRKQLFAAEAVGLSYEYYAGSDTYRQNRLFVGSPHDENGVLLYPDGQPRFRMVYVNGGAATLHGKSLTAIGRSRLQQFNSAGGAYCGSCAGSFFSGRNVDDRDNPREGYLNIFPFNTRNTGIKKSRLVHQVPENSPLLTYREFGEDRRIEEVYHNNGNWLPVNEGQHLAETEVLAIYDNPKHKIHGGAAIWAFRKDDFTGRVVNIGSHPEGVESGERLALTEACFLYALDGTGRPQIKGTLLEGQTRVMDRSTSDQLPRDTRIGDKQYHHFRLEVPEGGEDVRLTLRSASSADLELYLRREGPAFRSNAKFAAGGGGSEPTIRARLEPGVWFASVHCATTVQAINDDDSGFYRYHGNLEVLNGVAYSIEFKSNDRSAE